MLKTLAFSITISFALLFLSNCSNSEPSKDSSNQNGLYIKCQRTIGAKKTLAEAEIFESEEFAVLTNSNGKTHIHLDEIGLNCLAADPKFFRITLAVDADTLKLNEEFYMDARASCSCKSSLDLDIESIGNSIKYLVYNYEDGYSVIFPVKYE